MENKTPLRDAYYSQLPLPGASPQAAAAGPNNPPWNSATAFSVWLLSVLLIVFVPDLFVIPYALRRQVPLTDSARLVEFLQSDPTAVIISLAAIIPAHVLTLLTAWLIVTRFRRFDFREMLGWRSGGITWWHYVAILLGFFAVALVVAHTMPEEENSLLKVIRSSRSAVFLLAFLATFTAPLVEEIVYRGVLYSAFQRSMGTVLAILIVTLLFTLVHVPQYYPSWSTIILLTLLSLILTLIRAVTGNLWPCIVLHFLFNAIQSLGLIVSPYFESPTPAPPAISGFLLHLLFK